MEQAPPVRMSKHGQHVKVAGQPGGSSLVSGEGIAIVDGHIEQDAAYWEVEVVEVGNGPGPCRVGVTLKPEGNQMAGQLMEHSVGPLGPFGATAQESKAVKAGMAVELHKGDVVGVAFGQGEVPNLRFYQNGESLDDCTVNMIRGSLHPAVSVGAGAQVILTFNESLFKFPMPRGSQAVITLKQMM